MAVHLLGARDAGRSRALIVALAPLLMLAAVGPVQSYDQDEIEAAFVLRFPAYVSWPPDAFESASDPLRIGIVGETSIAGELESQAERKHLGERSITVQRLDTTGMPDRLHVLIVGDIEPEVRARIVDLMARRPVLTVSAADGFIDSGGMIELLIQNGVARFAIGRGAARAAGLQISTKVLVLATRVKDR